jgi:hypothetical protein
MKRMETGKLLKMILDILSSQVAFPTPLHKESEIPLHRWRWEFQRTLESGLL